MSAFSWFLIKSNYYILSQIDVNKIVIYINGISIASCLEEIIFSDVTHNLQ